MQLASLGSGSRGNATLVRRGDSALLIDLGFGLRTTVQRLAALGIEASRIEACLVTHEHSDHLSGVAAFARRYAVPVYLTEGTRRAWAGRESLDGIDIRAVDLHVPFQVSDFEVTPVPVPHDAREPVQYVIAAGESRLGILTDLGRITPVVETAYGRCTALLVEANHDLEMLRYGGYPPALKRRVGSDWGHLNNTQTARFVERMRSHGNLRHLIVGHISQQNNRPDLVAACIEPVCADLHSVHYATQDAGLDWIDLT